MSPVGVGKGSNLLSTGQNVKVLKMTIGWRMEIGGLESVVSSPGDSNVWESIASFPSRSGLQTHFDEFVAVKRLVVAALFTILLYERSVRIVRNTLQKKISPSNWQNNAMAN